MKANPSGSRAARGLLAWAMLVGWSVWSATPLVNYRAGTAVGALLAVAAVAILLPSSSGKLGVATTWGGVFLVTLLPYLVSGTLSYGTFESTSLIVAFALFLVGIPLSELLRSPKAERLDPWLPRIIMVCYIIGAIMTVRGVRINPYAARLLAADRPEAAPFKALGVGGYGFIYSSVFVMIMMAGLILSPRSAVRRVDRWLALLTLTACSASLVAGAYTIALLLLFLGFLLYLAIMRAQRVGVAIALGSAVILTAKPDIVPTVLEFGVRLVGADSIVGSKLYDLSQALTGGMVAGTQTGNRISLYQASYKAFLQNPIFGLNGGGNVSWVEVGGHAAWPDLLAYFGLFSTVPFLVAISSHLISVVRSMPKIPGSCAKVCLLLVLILGFLNPVTYIYQIGFVLLFFIPVSRCLWVEQVREGVER